MIPTWHLSDGERNTKRLFVPQATVIYYKYSVGNMDPIFTDLVKKMAAQKDSGDVISL